MGRNVYEILKLNPNIPSDYEVLEKEYIPVGIDSVKIGGKTYTNYGAYWFFWEKAYLKEVSRSGDGSMPTINNVTTFLTGHLVIDFSLISIDDYRSLMRSHYEQNEFIVECYDPIYNKITTLKMYFATEERKKLYVINKSRLNNNTWEDFLVLAGVQDYQLEMIGTNNDLSTLSVTYNLNPPPEIGDPITVIGGQDVAKGCDFICGQAIEYDVKGETFNGRYRFVGWNDSPYGDGQPYIDGNAYIINTALVLYAKWEKSNVLTLTYNYGIATPMADEKGNPVYTKQVENGKAIGDLPTFEATPAVTVNGTKYYPYKNGGWYKTATKAPNSVALKASDLYWSVTDTQIHLLYDTEKYSALFYSEDDLQVAQTLEYNTAVPNLEIYRDGYEFKGWFLDHTFKTPAPALMPPYNIILYGKWVKDDYYNG